MWCRQCQQDVPGIAVKDDGNRICCARCSGLLSSEAPRVEAVEPTPDPLRSPPALEDWNLDADLAAVTRMMRSLRIDTPAAAPAMEPLRIPVVPPPAPVERPKSPKRSAAFAWPALMLGMMTFTCGAVLTVWSFVAGRDDLWTYGLPAVLAGQGLLVLGLVLQLEGLWQNNRDTRETLDDLDRELAELRHATAVLTSTHTAPSQSFYNHMAEGASPHLLLADVKGQLDVIAMRLANVKK